MNQTYGDMMGEYESKREAVKRFGTWDELDSFVHKLISKVAPKPEKHSSGEKQQVFGFDDMGTVVPIDHD